MYNIHFTDEFEQDLVFIQQYTVLIFGERQKEIYQSKIDSGLAKLRKMPTIGHSRSDLPNEYLCFPVEQHFIIYQIDEENKSINIIRILNSKMDFEEQF